MGSGCTLKCPKCEFTYAYRLGVGFLFPMVYKETVQKAKEGELGEEMKSFFAEHPYGAINAERVLLCCRECGSFDSRKDLTMYLPKEKSSEEEPSYVMDDELKMHYTVYQKYPHRCKKCGGGMEIIGGGKIRKKLLCPECGSVLENEFTMCWD